MCMAQIFCGFEGLITDSSTQAALIGCQLALSCLEAQY